MKRILFALILAIFTQPLFAGTVQLAWDRNSESYCAGYNVYRSTSSGQYSAANKINSALLPQTGAGVAPTFTDSGAASGHTYFYVVTAVNTDGLESGYSNEVKAIIVNPAPASPTGLTVKAIASASIIIDGTVVATANVGDPLGFQIPRQAPPRSYAVAVTWNFN